MIDSTLDAQTVAWPERDAEWQRLAATAALLLHTAHENGFGPTVPTGDGASVGGHAVARHRAADALLEMADLARDWLRSSPPEPLTGKLIEQLCSPDPIAEVLADCHNELLAPADLLKTVSSALPGGVVPTIDGRVLPCAVATVAAARAHAVLLATAEGGQQDASDEMLAVADLVYQSRVLRALCATGIPIHPYLVWVMARAVELCSVVAGAAGPVLRDELGDLQSLTSSATEKLLAEDVLYGSRSVTGVALAFSAATLALPDDPDSRYIDAALASAAAAQHGTGLWAEGRRITGHADPDTGSPTLLSSHEVALAMTQALSWKLVADPTIEAATPIISAIQRSLRHAATSQIPLDGGLAGWAADPAFGQVVVDTDATSAVLRLVVMTRRVADSESAAQALKGFDLVWRPGIDPTAPYLVWTDYIAQNEPDAKNPILPKLNEWFVERVKEHRRVDRRPWSPAKGGSLLLFGPPGTTKTTIVKAMAQGLEWPLVTLSPGDFIRDGLEQVERRAIHLFKLLERLVAAVVLFDECDELFRSREHSSNDNDQLRSISAFMTASMLPKLQDLRDRERIIFVIATNYFGQIDPAAKRIGRIDHIVGVGWPDGTQREHMIRSQLEASASSKALEPEIREEAISQLTEKTRYCIRADIVQIASKLDQRAPELSSKSMVDSVVDQLVATATKIQEKDLTLFREEAGKSSETHRPGTGELL